MREGPSSTTGVALPRQSQGMAAIPLWTSLMRWQKLASPMVLARSVIGLGSLCRHHMASETLGQKAGVLEEGVRKASPRA